MKETNIKKMNNIGQPPEKRRMKHVDDIMVNHTNVEIYVDSDVSSSDYYICHKRIQDLFGTKHDAGQLLGPIKRAKCLYPNIAYGRDIDKSPMTSVFINLAAYTILADSQVCSDKFHEIKIHLYDAFKEYVDMHDNKDSLPDEKIEVQEMEEKEEQAAETIDKDSQTAEEQQQPPVNWTESEEILIPPCPVTFPLPSFSMFDEKEDSVGTTTSDTVQKQLEQREESENDNTVSELQGIINKACEKACESYKTKNQELGKKIDELLAQVELLTQTNTALSEQNNILNSRVKTVAVPNNISTSKILYQLADSMTCYPVDVYNVVYNAITAKSVEEYPEDRKFKQMWKLYNDDIRAQLINQGCDLTLFDMDKGILKQTPEQKEERKKYGPLKIEEVLYEYMIKGLGYSKQALLILYNFLNDRYHDTSTIVDAVKRYFRMDNTNAAIHWLHRFGIYIDYED